MVNSEEQASAGAMKREDEEESAEGAVPVVVDQSEEKEISNSGLRRLNVDFTKDNHNYNNDKVCFEVNQITNDKSDQ